MKIEDQVTNEDRKNCSYSVGSNLQNAVLWTEEARTAVEDYGNQEVATAACLQASRYSVASCEHWMDVVKLLIPICKRRPAPDFTLIDPDGTSQSPTNIHTNSCQMKIHIDILLEFLNRGEYESAKVVARSIKDMAAAHHSHWMRVRGMLFGKPTKRVAK